MNDKYKYYLYDLGFELREMALEAKNEFEASKNNKKAYDFHSGRLSAFRAVMGRIMNKAIAFDIPPEDLRLDNFEPDNLS